MNTEKELPDLPEGVQIKPVVGYEGLYSVTSDGRVWSQPREIFRAKAPKSGRNRPRKIGGRWLVPRFAGRGYPQVALCKDGKVVGFYVHSLVAEAFLGARKEGLIVDHINRDITDNRAENLQYTTYGMNLQNKVVRGCMKVGERGKPWLSRIKLEGKVICLGYHASEEEAAAAYVGARKVLFHLAGRKLAEDINP